MRDYNAIVRRIYSLAPSNYLNTKAPSYKKVKWLGIIGIVMFVTGVFLRIAIPIILTIGFHWQLKFEDGNILTWIFRKVPVAAQVNVYLWDLQNPEEFQQGAKPKMREVGPFLFHLYVENEIEFSADGYTMKDWVTITAFYDEDRSADSYDDKITMVNLITYVAAGTTQNILDKIPLSFALQPIIYGFMGMYFSLHDEGLIKVTTPRRLAEGETLSMIATVDQLIFKPLKWLGLELPYNIFELIERHLPNNKFGLLSAINGTKIGPIEMHTGKGDPRRIGHIISIMDNILDNPINSILTGGKCIQNSGPVPIFFGHYLGNDQAVNIYTPCRPIELTKTGIKFIRGSPQWGYHWLPSYKAGTYKDPNNPCVCRYPKNPDMCDGLFDLGTCVFLAPVSLSLPHFLYASDKITSTVEGMHPDPDKHELFLYLNPTLGTPVFADARIQVNLVTRSHTFLSGFGSVPDSIYPLLWIEAGFFPGGILEYLVYAYLNALTLLDYGPYLLVLGGMTTLGLASLIAFKDKGKLLKASPKLAHSPIPGLDPLDRQMQTKVRGVYPDFFTVTDGIQAVPALTNQMYVNRSATVVRRNSLGQSQHHINVSTPGVVE